MPYIMTTSLYPSDKSTEVAKKYIEAITLYPPDSNLGVMIIPSAVKTTLDGIRTIGVIEVKKGKFEDAMSWTRNMMSLFLSVPGFEYSIDSYATVEECMALPGMKQ